MEVMIDKTLSNNKYRASIDTQLKKVEVDLTKKFSEPTVDVGGTFTGPPALSLPTKIVKIDTGFPVFQEIDGTTDADAEDKMDVWCTDVKARLTTAIGDLRALTDNYSDDSIYEV